MTAPALNESCQLNLEGGMGLQIAFLIMTEVTSRPKSSGAHRMRQTNRGLGIQLPSPSRHHPVHGKIFFNAS